MKSQCVVKQNGLTLFELTVVVMILGIVTAVAIPQLSSTDFSRIELAAERVADAIRFARSESIRTGEVHGVLIDYSDSDSNGKDITVYKVDLEQSPFGIDSLVRHPIDKKSYDLNLVDSVMLRGVEFKNTSHPFEFDTVGRRSSLHFTPQGAPVFYSSGTPHRLVNGTAIIGQGGLKKQVSVMPVVGRVTVQ